MLRILVVVAGALGLLSGCSGGLKTARLVNEPLARGARVAVLPFENLSGQEGASAKLAEYFVLSLQGRKTLDILQDGQVYEQLRRFRIRSATLMTNAQIDSLCAAMSVAYVVVGSVLEYKETDNPYLGKIPQVSMNVRLIECAGYKTVWTGVVNARGDQSEWVFGLGAVRSLDELARSAADRAASDLSAMFAR